MISYIVLVRAALVVFGIAGAGLGWWHGTRLLYLRDLGAPVFGDEEIKPGLRVWHQLRRILWTVAGGVAGLVIGEIILVFLSRFLE